MDKLNSLTIFTRAAQTRNFALAAQQLGISPSTVSKAVSRLEERLGTRLLQRTTRSITLTDDGTRFYNRCCQILEDIEEAESELNRAQSHPFGTLRIGMVPSFARIHVMPALPEFAERYPDVNLELFLSDRYVDLIEEGFDGVVRVGKSPDSNFAMQSLASARLVVCASPNYFSRYGVPQTPEDLLHHNCINYVVPQTGRIREWTFQNGKKRLQLPVNGRFCIDNAEASVEAAIAGTGIIQLYNFVVGQAINQGQLVPILSNYAPAKVPISLIYAQKRYLCAKGQVFIEFLQKLIAQLKRERIVE
ncbi:LysR family transcriptional regulator [Scytonema sp. UIC 10036]|uniref:LysR family transcriptional regulator n=1 Tax=Scytonema sp. UIC 10036 TaxID=2304196 RepID=UPI0012DAD1EC|nr:LysR family transcriptional regulator [Scytonema sp. UIC 10036]MUG95624.1 LysR family transcriptional regulator [Scytonema sp. UIC 10036]